MIQVIINTNTGRKTVTSEVSETIMETIEKSNSSIGRATVSIDGKILKSDELDKTFAELGCDDGEQISLAVLVKGDGANS